jgi:hypothetical protein
VFALHTPYVVEVPLVCLCANGQQRGMPHKKNTRNGPRFTLSNIPNDRTPQTIVHCGCAVGVWYHHRCQSQCTWRFRELCIVTFDRCCLRYWLACKAHSRVFQIFLDRRRGSRADWIQHKKPHFPSIDHQVSPDSRAPSREPTS